MELQPEKSNIFPLHRGINFLGFRIFYHYKLLKKSNLNTFRKKLADLEQDYISGDISRDKLQERVNGWLEYAKWGNTYKLRKKVTSHLLIFSTYFKQ